MEDFLLRIFNYSIGFRVTAMKKLNLYPYLKILHPVTSIAVTIVTMIASLPLTESFSMFSLILVGLSMLSIQFSIGITNDLLDIDFDSIAKPWKPLVNGTASIKMSYVVLAFLIIISFLSVFQLGFLAIFFLYFGFFLGIIYNFGFKRTVYSWLPYSLAIPTVMVYARIIQNNPNFFLLVLLYPLGLLAGPALNIANQLPDAEEAKQSGENSLIHKLGIKTAEKLSVILLLLLLIGTGLNLLILNDLNYVSMIFIILATLFILMYIFLLKRNFLILAWPISILIISLLGFSFLPSFYG